jgi:chromosomal replication initiator protein
MFDKVHIIKNKAYTLAYDMDYEQLWNTVLSQIGLEVSRVNFNTWFKNSRMVDYKDGDVTVGVPNQFIKDWLEQKYHKDILRILRSVHESVRSLSFSVVRFDTPPKKTQVIQTNLNSLPLDNLYINREDGLNPKYTFDSYIVGPFNEVAHVSAQAIIQNPGLSYNPFFVYGNTGLGKTHLLQAIGNSIKKKYPEKKVFYISLERFYMEYVNALNQSRVPHFKEKYRKFDVFIMDDIQFITGKEKTQDELFHLFNIMYETNRQIIFSSDVHPNFIIGLEERLRSRFNQGMVVDVEAPTFESRLAILKRKTKDHNDKLSDEVLEYIAGNVHGNIRELEGILTNLITQSEIKKMVLSLTDVKNYLKNNIKAKKSVSIPEIVKTVADYYHVNDSLIYNKTRRKDIIKPRQIIMYILREEYDISYPVIGDKLGGRDHTTVIHSYEKIKKELEKDPHLAKEIDDIRSIIV